MDLLQELKEEIDRLARLEGHQQEGNRLSQLLSCLPEYKRTGGKSFNVQEYLETIQRKLLSYCVSAGDPQRMLEVIRRARCW